MRGRRNLFGVDWVASVHDNPHALDERFGGRGSQWMCNFFASGEAAYALQQSHITAKLIELHLK